MPALHQVPWRDNLRDQACWYALTPVRWVVCTMLKFGLGFNLYGSEGPQPTSPDKWPHDMWERLEAERADQGLQVRPIIVPDQDDIINKWYEKQGDNFGNFVAAVLCAVWKCIRRVELDLSLDAAGAAIRVSEVPRLYKAHWGNPLDKDRLGLNDLRDLADLLALFTGSFQVDDAEPGGPLVSSRPGGQTIVQVDEPIAKMLWLRAHRLQSKKLLDAISMYKGQKEVARRSANLIYRQRRPLAMWAEVAARVRRNKRKAQKGLRRKARKRKAEARGADPAAQAVARNTAHHPGCRCPACAAERAAGAYFFLLPPKLPESGELRHVGYGQKKVERRARQAEPRGSVRASIYGKRLTATESARKLFERAEELLAGQLHGTCACPSLVGMQRAAVIPGAPTVLPGSYPSPLPLTPLTSLVWIRGAWQEGWKTQVKSEAASRRGPPLVTPLPRPALSKTFSARASHWPVAPHPCRGKAFDETKPGNADTRATQAPCFELVAIPNLPCGLSGAAFSAPSLHPPTVMVTSKCKDIEDTGHNVKSSSRCVHARLFHRCS